MKVVYRQYDDKNFTIPSPHEAHLGILGPVIRGEIGDVIKIVFFNNASFPYSLMLNGPTVPLNQTAIKDLGLDDNPQGIKTVIQSTSSPFYNQIAGCHIIE